MTKRRSPPPSSSSSKGGEGEEVEGETKRAEGEDDEGRAGNNPGWVTSSRAVPFLYLSLDIPPTPLFKVRCDVLLFLKIFVLIIVFIPRPLLIL